MSKRVSTAMHLVKKLSQGPGTGVESEVDEGGPDEVLNSA